MGAIGKLTAAIENARRTETFKNKDNALADVWLYVWGSAVKLVVSLFWVLVLSYFMMFLWNNGVVQLTGMRPARSVLHVICLTVFVTLLLG